MHKPPFIRSPYNYDVEQASDEAAIPPGGPSLTVQSMSEDADLNIMLQRFKVTGKMPDVVRLPSYGDFSEVTDFQSAMDAIIEAQDNFMELPAHVRAKFDNDPQMLLDFSSNPDNMKQLKEIFGEAEVQIGGKNVSSVSGAVGTPAAAADSAVGVSAPSGSGGAG